MNEDKNDSIHELITRCLTGEASAMEQRELATWRSAHVDNEALFQQFSKALSHADVHLSNVHSPELASIDLDREWAHFTKNIEKKPTVERKLFGTPGGSFTWLRIAAAVAFLVTAGWLVNYWVSKSGVTSFHTTDQTLAIQLPDGSSILLNKNSTLQYGRAFGDEVREVELKGEAFFEVTRNEQIPFVINVEETRVEVLGTSFNIRSDHTQVEVVVTTGLVKFAAENRTGVQLAAGEKGVYDSQRKQIEKRKNDDVNFDAWKTKQLVFTEASLVDVVETLNRVFGANVVLATSVPSTCVVTVSFEQQSLDAILRVLESTLQLTYRKNGSAIEITRVGC